MDSLLDQLKGDHHDFSGGGLGLTSVSNPFELFQIWLDEAIKAKCPEPNAMTVATHTADSISTRIVYLKEYMEEGFVFYTNYRSQKGVDLQNNPICALQFYWISLARQVHIRGKAEKIPAVMSDAYFASRPRESQIGAWASHQSEVLQHRDELLKRIDELEKKFPHEVPRPEHWGGFVVKPHSYEFWQGMANRIHERVCFAQQGAAWKKFLKNP